MGTTADKLNAILNTKEAIKQAIRDKGVYIGDYDAFADYPDAIRSIETSSDEGSADEFFNLRTMDGTNFNYLFYCYPGSELDLSNWDTSNVNNMRNMFNSCYNLQTLNISNFNTENVTDMSSMFQGCSNLASLDISNFDIGKVENTSYMFIDCYYLRELRLDHCSTETVEKIVTSYDFPTNTIEGVTRKIYVNPENLGDLEAPEGWIFVDYETGEEIIPKKPGLTVYQEGEYRDNTGITEVYTLVTKEHTDLREMFQYCNNLTTINGIEQWDTSNVIDMNRMFDGCNNLTSLDLSSFITGNVTNMEYMFADCNNLKTLDIRNFDMSKVENTNDMFGGCDELKVLRLDNYDRNTIERIINYSNLPYGDKDGTSRLMYVQEANIINPDNQDERLTAPDGWKFVYVAGNPQDTYDSDSRPFKEDRDIQEVNVAVTKKHIDLSRMFERCENLEIIHNIDTWDTSNVRIMNDMFNTCYKLIYLDLSSWNIDRIENMNGMFERCDNLIYLDIRNFNISDSTEIRDMFSDCYDLQVLRLDNCDDSIIKRIINDTNLPTGDIDGRLRKMYILEKFATNPEEYGLTAPDGWEFAYVEAKKE